MTINILRNSPGYTNFLKSPRNNMVIRVYKRGKGSGSLAGRQTPGDLRQGVFFGKPLQFLQYIKEEKFLSDVIL